MNSPSGLELNDARRKAPRPSASERANGMAPPVRRPRESEPVQDDDIDPANGGAFIVILLAHVVLGLIVAVQSPGDAVITVGMFAVSAVLTFVFYWVTGWLGRQFGLIAILLFGGWFSLLVGMIAQGVHQLMPWLGWKLTGGIVALAFAFAFALDMR